MGQDYLRLLGECSADDGSGDAGMGRRLRVASGLVESRTDVTTLKLEDGEDRLLDEEALAAAEKGTECLLLFRVPTAAEVLISGVQVQVSRGGLSYTGSVEEVEPADGSVTLRLRVSGGSEKAGDDAPIVPELLIFGHDGGPSGLSGRSEALRRVRHHLANPPAPEEAWGDAGGAWSGAGGGADAGASWKQESTTSWDQK